MNKKVIIPTIALVAILATFTFGTMPVSAQSPVYGNLVTKIAQRFNLKESDVLEVVNEVHKERFTLLESKWEAKLTQAVKEGKITEAQKSALIAKRKEVLTKLETIMSSNDTNKKAKYKEVFEEVKKWASDNGIDMKFIPLGISKRGFKLSQLKNS